MPRLARRRIAGGIAGRTLGPHFGMSCGLERQAPFAAGACIVGQQGRRNLLRRQRAGRRQVLIHQFEQAFHRQLMGLTGSRIQPVTERQKTRERGSRVWAEKICDHPLLNTALMGIAVLNPSYALLDNGLIMTAIASNLQAVNHIIAQALRTVQRRGDDVKLLAVSKAFPAAAVREAYQAGLSTFGESYVQEALDKIETLRDLPLQWHFIGPIQSNKTRAIAQHFSWVHSVDRLNIAERLSAQRPANLLPLNVCIQVNLSGEESKSGVAPEQLAELAQSVALLPHIELRGLMTIPAPASKLAAQRVPFARLRELLQALNDQGLELDTLSMGMSHDIEAAVLEGATIVRVGTAIFGERNYGEK